MILLPLRAFPLGRAPHLAPPGLAVEGILRLRTTGTQPHAQWRMLRGRKHARSVRRMTAFEGILRELSVNRLERTFGVQSRSHGRQLCISDTATLARHPSQQAAQHLPCGRPPDLFGPTRHPKLSSAMRSISPTMVSAFDIEHA